MARIRSAGRIVLIIISVPVGFAVILLGVLLALSPGRPRPFVDENGKTLAGSVSEKIWVSINGVEQGMFIKGRNVSNPVLLFLHGGMAMPEYFMTQRYPTGLDESFTVCWWERRGAGLTYGSDAPPDTISVEQMVADTIKVTHYLRSRFHKDKIYLMTHSGGSIIGIQAAARAPELYAAYIGVSQMTHQIESERLSYEYMLNRYRELGNSAMVRRFEAEVPGPTPPLPASYMRIRDKAMHELGVGTTRDMKSVITGVFLQSWLVRDYTIGEKLNLWRGKFSMDRALWDTTIAMDITRLVPMLDVPAYFFHGRYDYTVSYPMAKAYFEKLAAPLKGFYTFEQSAHSPMFEEPARMRQIFEQDVLKGSTHLADAR